MIQGMNPFDGPGKQAGAGPSKAGEEAHLQEACQQFEEMFLNQMMKQMRKAGPKGGMFGSSAGSDQFADMMDQERAKQWSQNGGVGLASMLFEQMKQQM
ncbi:MAG: rod-binding protein [Vulcanimicrobiota bacterium]